MAACGRGSRVRFFRLTELATLLMEARDERSLLGLKARLAKLDLLVLDELGCVSARRSAPSCSSTHLERLRALQPDRYDHLPFASWTEVFGSERLTGATLDRLTHRCQIIETKGESYRLRDAKAKMRKEGTAEGGGSSDRDRPRRNALEGGETSS